MDMEAPHSQKMLSQFATKAIVKVEATHPSLSLPLHLFLDEEEEELNDELVNLLLFTRGCYRG